MRQAKAVTSTGLPRNVPSKVGNVVVVVLVGVTDVAVVVVRVLVVRVLVVVVVVRVVAVVLVVGPTGRMMPSFW